MCYSNVNLKYFDIPKENWDFMHIKEKLYETHNLCISDQLKNNF